MKTLGWGKEEESIPPEPAPRAVLLAGEVRGRPLRRGRCWLLTWVQNQVDAAGAKQQWEVRSRLLLLPVLK